MPCVRLSAVSLVAALALALPSSVGAQDARGRARALFGQGVGAMDANNPAAAVSYFEQSYASYPRASTACNLALALERTARGCEAVRWYQQCAALDSRGTHRGQANARLTVLSPQCSNGRARFGRAPPPPSASTTAALMRANPWIRRRSFDHTALGLGIASLVLGAGGLVGGGVAALEASSQRDQLAAVVPPGSEVPVALPANSAAADLYNRANTLSTAAIALYVGGAVLSALGVLLIVVDLARPGVLSSRAAAPAPGPHLVLMGAASGGGSAALRWVF